MRYCMLNNVCVTAAKSDMNLFMKACVECGLWNIPSCIAFQRAHQGRIQLYGEVWQPPYLKFGKSIAYIYCMYEALS